MIQADRIRQHALTRHVEPARRAGQDTVTITAGDASREMGLDNRVPAVCSALGSQKFQDCAGVQLLERRGPWQSTTTEFIFAIGDKAEQERAPLSRPRAGSIVQPIETDSVTGADAGLYLISCVSGKLSTPAPAKDLYTSDWFRKARAYVERKDQPWFILSAKHGLVHPDTVIARYEKTLNFMPVAERRAWARMVLAEVEPHLAGVGSVVFLAGQRYREFLEPALCDRGIAVIVPMAGLRIGEQLSWLGQGPHE